MSFLPDVVVVGGYIEMNFRHFWLALAVFSLSGVVFPATAQPDAFARALSPNSVKSRTNSSKTNSRRRLNKRDLREDFAEALQIIETFHIEGTPNSSADATKNAINGMLRALDPHSNFFDAPEYQELQAEHHSSYVGIGAPIAVFKRGNTADTYITSVMTNSPAFRAGLRFGDKIVEVDGKACAGRHIFEVRDKIRGAKDTTVRLTIERASNGRLETLVVKRSEVFAPSLPDAYLIGDETGYIDLTEGFSMTTADELRLALDALHEAGAQRLILDLRGNTGGIVSQAVKTASFFLPKGKIVLTQKGRNAFDTQTFRADEDNPQTLPLVILVDGRTASAAEIVAGALQDHDRALIIGETTFGKGLVQSVIPLDGGEAVTLTTARYFTPSGRSIQRDYENVSTYEYFNASAQRPSENGKATFTLTEGGRKVFGGNGIAPDYRLPAEKTLSQSKKIIEDAAFAFVREAVNGRIVGLENLRVSRPYLKGYRLTTNDLPITEKVSAAFETFARQNNFAAAIPRSLAERSEAAYRLRYFLAMATYGSTTARQVSIERDGQVLRALQMFPQARQIANLNRPILQNR